MVNNDKWFHTWEDFLEIFHEQFNALMDDESGSFDRNFFSSSFLILNKLRIFMQTNIFLLALHLHNDRVLNKTSYKTVNVFEGKVVH